MSENKIFCSNCGKQINEYVQFCPYCGQKNDFQSINWPDEPDRKAKKKEEHQYQSRQKIIVPYPHQFQNRCGNNSWFQNRNQNLEIYLNRIATIDQRCFFDFQRNTFYKTGKHENCKTCTKSKVNNADIVWIIEFQGICCFCKCKHNHLERNYHTKYEQIV